MKKWTTLAMLAALPATAAVAAVPYGAMPPGFPKTEPAFPIMAAAAMTFSSLSVVGNALRLRAAKI